jgi:hypothetical protein
MQSSGEAHGRHNHSFIKKGLSGLVAALVAAWIIYPAGKAQGEEVSTNSVNTASDPVLGLMLEKGMITEDEAAKVQAQVEALRTNPVAVMPPSKWNISRGIKNIEVFGDLRLRYEDRSETAPGGQSIDLNRFRYALRFGFRGEAFDDFYYGFRMETAANPRSSWVTLGSSTSGSPFQGPFGKSNGGLGVGQIYLGWHPTSWFDFTVGKMPNPLYTTPMVWSSSINPEGLAEKFKYTVGDVDFFATFAQFLYADQNPISASGGLGFNGLVGQTSQNIFQIAWQGGLIYHITTNLSAKVGATVYQYYGLKQSSASGGVSPFFGDPYVGEGAFTGAGTINGASGFGTSGTLPGNESLGYPNNQVGLDHLLVLEVPFEITYRFKRVDARIFGDVAYNLEGRERAEAAAAGYANYLAQPQLFSTITGFAPQTSDNKAYQIGFAVGSHDALGLVNGTSAGKNSWEFRTYWQHVEQYALDPNLVDTDFFAGAQNMQGLYVALAYGFTDNYIATFRYGHASRINNLLGTGGTGQDIPQINPIRDFDLFQVDLTFKF